MVALTNRVRDRGLKLDESCISNPKAEILDWTVCISARRTAANFHARGSAQIADGVHFVIQFEPMNAGVAPKPE